MSDRIAFRPPSKLWGKNGVPSDEDLRELREMGHTRSAWCLRLPLIRHIRAIRLMVQINAHYDRWSAIGSLPVRCHYDYAVAFAIWHNALLPKARPTDGE